MSLIDLPDDVLRIVVKNISKQVIRKNMSNPQLAIKILSRLASTSKIFNTIIDNETWMNAWETYIESHEYLKNLAVENPKASLLLYSMTGCQFCKKPRIRKIYEEFNIRCCQECLYERTISDYRLKNDYLVNTQNLHLKYIKKDLWARQIGSYTLNFYSIKEVENKLQMSLQEYYIVAKEIKDKNDAIERKRRFEVNALRHSKFMENLHLEIQNRINSVPFSKEFMDSFIESYKIEPETSVNKVINDAILFWNGKELDKFLKKLTRKNKLSIIDVRKTNIYNEKIENSIFNFTDDDWKTAKQQIYNCS